MSEENELDQLETTANGWFSKSLGRKAAYRWILTALAGAFSITIFGIIEQTGNNLAFFRYGIPVALIIFYASYGYNDTRNFSAYPSLRKARIGQLADSVYFLGFLWTLWALIDSFVINETSVTEAVFRTFGYALVATATGMFVRLAIIQFSYSADEQESLGEQKIEEEVALFSKEVENTRKSLKKLQIDTLESADRIKTAIDVVAQNSISLADEIKINKESINKTAEELVEDVIDSMQEPVDQLNEEVEVLKETLELQVESIADISKEATEKIKGTNQEIFDSLEDSAKAADKFAKSFPSTMDSILNKLANLANQLNGIKVSPDIIADAFKEATLEANTIILDKINELQTEFSNKQGNLISKTDDFTSKLEELSQRVNNISIPTDIVENQIKQKLSNSILEIEESINRLDTSIKLFEQTIKNANAEVLNTKRRKWPF